MISLDGIQGLKRVFQQQMNVCLVLLRMIEKWTEFGSQEVLRYSLKVGVLQKAMGPCLDILHPSK